MCSMAPPPGKRGTKRRRKEENQKCLALLPQGRQTIRIGLRWFMLLILSLPCIYISPPRLFLIGVLVGETHILGLSVHSLCPRRKMYPFTSQRFSHDTSGTGLSWAWHGGFRFPRFPLRPAVYLFLSLYFSFPLSTNSSLPQSSGRRIAWPSDPFPVAVDVWACMYDWGGNRGGIAPRAGPAGEAN